VYLYRGVMRVISNLSLILLGAFLLQLGAASSHAKGYSNLNFYLSDKGKNKLVSELVHFSSRMLKDKLTEKLDYASGKKPDAVVKHGVYPQNFGKKSFEKTEIGGMVFDFLKSQGLASDGQGVKFYVEHSNIEIDFDIDPDNLKLSMPVQSGLPTIKVSFEIKNIKIHVDEVVICKEAFYSSAEKKYTSCDRRSLNAIFNTANIKIREGHSLKVEVMAFFTKEDDGQLRIIIDSDETTFTIAPYDFESITFGFRAEPINIIKDGVIFDKIDMMWIKELISPRDHSYRNEEEKWRKAKKRQLELIGLLIKYLRNFATDSIDGFLNAFLTDTKTPMYPLNTKAGYTFPKEKISVKLNSAGELPEDAILMDRIYFYLTEANLKLKQFELRVRNPEAANDLNKLELLTNSQFSLTYLDKSDRKYYEVFTEDQASIRAGANPYDPYEFLAPMASYLGATTNGRERYDFSASVGEPLLDGITTVLQRVLLGNDAFNIIEDENIKVIGLRTYVGLPQHNYEYIAANYPLFDLKEKLYVTALVDLNLKGMCEGGSFFSTETHGICGSNYYTQFGIDTSKIRIPLTFAIIPEIVRRRENCECQDVDFVDDAEVGMCYMGKGPQIDFSSPIGACQSLKLKIESPFWEDTSSGVVNFVNPFSHTEQISLVQDAYFVSIKNRIKIKVRQTVERALSNRDDEDNKKYDVNGIFAGEGSQSIFWNPRTRQKTFNLEFSIDDLLNQRGIYIKAGEIEMTRSGHLLLHGDFDYIDFFHMTLQPYEVVQ
jgi:hypothetical protein